MSILKKIFTEEALLAQIKSICESNDTVASRATRIRDLLSPYNLPFEQGDAEYMVESFDKAPDVYVAFC